MPRTVTSSVLQQGSTSGGDVKLVERYRLSDGTEYTRSRRVPADTELTAYQSVAEAEVNAMLAAEDARRAELAADDAERENLLTFLLSRDLPVEAGMDPDRVDRIIGEIQ